MVNRLGRVFSLGASVLSVLAGLGVTSVQAQEASANRAFSAPPAFNVYHITLDEAKHRALGNSKLRQLALYNVQAKGEAVYVAESDYYPKVFESVASLQRIMRLLSCERGAVLEWSDRVVRLVPRVACPRQSARRCVTWCEHDTRSSASCDDGGSPVPLRWMWKAGVCRPRRSGPSPGWERIASARFCRSTGNAARDAAAAPAFPARCQSGNDGRRGGRLRP